MENSKPKMNFKDPILVIWLTLVGLTLEARLSRNMQTDSLDLSNSTSIVSGLLDAVFGALLTGILYFLILLPFVIYRNSRNKPKLESQIRNTKSAESANELKEISRKKFSNCGQYQGIFASICNEKGLLRTINS